MNFMAYKLVGSLIIPPGLFSIVLILIAISVFKNKRDYNSCGILLLFSLVLYLCSTPLGAEKITGFLESRNLSRISFDEDAAAIIVLSGGSTYDNNGDAVQPGSLTLERVFAAVKLAKEKNLPIIFSGGKVYGTEKQSEASGMAKAARDMGYKGKLILEEKSRTTAENFSYLAELVNSAEIQIVPAEKAEDNKKLSFILVTSAFHMPRSLLAAEKYFPEAKMHPYVLSRYTNPKFTGFQQLLPDGYSLMLSCYGIKEYLGIILYKVF